jgi:exodeoxyribonuclease-3
MKVISWNVNGIRAAVRKGFLGWLAAEDPDVLMIQETKAQPDQLAPEVLTEHGYHCVWASAQKKGYSGVSTWSRVAPDFSQVGLGIERFDNEGRTVITDFGDLRFYNCYFPNGQHDCGRVPYKLDFTSAVHDHAELARLEGKRVIVSGDWNTAHRPIDLARPSQNRANTGFLPEECAALDRWFEAGWVDTFRHLNPATEGAYSWWTYRGGARERNVGWRIDYHVVSAELAPAITRAWISPEVMGSDHCPLGIVIAV